MADPKRKAGLPPKGTAKVPLPKDQPKSKVKVQLSGGGSAPATADDLHSAEQRMLDDVGLYKHRKPQVTVESLLRDREQQRRDSGSAAAGGSGKAAAGGGAAAPKDSGSDDGGGGGGGLWSASTASSHGTDGPFALLTSMTARLATVEKIANKQADTIRRKEETIAELKQRVGTLERMHSANGNAELAGQLHALESENDRLKKQMHEMETFLADYGLIWVGFKADDEDDDDAAAAGAAGAAGANDAAAAGAGAPQVPGASAAGATGAAGAAAGAGGDKPMVSTRGSKPAFASKPSAPAAGASTTAAAGTASAKEKEIYFDMKKMAAAVADLNALAGEGQMRIVAERGVHKFKAHEPVPLTVFRNGLFFKNGPLRPFAMPEAQSFVADILEGYFPYELKDEYPDGVVFVLTDKSAELHTAQTPNPHASSFAKGKGGQSAAQFLSALPHSVVSKGKVIEIRSDIASVISKSDVFQPDRADARKLILVNTPTIELLAKRKAAGAGAGGGAAAPGTGGALGLGSADDARPQTPADITTLRVKLDDGTPPLLMKMRFTDTIGAVRKYIDRERKSGGHDKSPYEIRTTFPAKVYAQPDQTLLAAHLTPNAAIVVRTLPTASAAGGAAAAANVPPAAK